MALPDSGVLSLDDIQTEFGGTNPISMSEYYRGGSFVTDNNTSVPTSGEISFSDFYGGVNQFTLTISSNTENADVRSLAVTAGWNESSPLIANINSNVYCWSDSTSSAGLIISGAFANGLTVNNSGYIMGKGGIGGVGAGTGAGGNGGTGLSVLSSSSITIVNNSGAYIAGGGGGGGRAAGSIGNSYCTGWWRWRCWRRRKSWRCCRSSRWGCCKRYWWRCWRRRWCLCCSTAVATIITVLHRGGGGGRILPGAGGVGTGGAGCWR